MKETTAEQLNTPESQKPNAVLLFLKKAWKAFLAEGERMRLEEEEIREMRLLQLRAEEEQIELYGEEYVEEQEEAKDDDLAIFTWMDRVNVRLEARKKQLWTFLRKKAKTNDRWKKAVKSLNAHVKKREKSRAARLANRALEGFDEAGESIFEILPKSWQEAYLHLENDTVENIEARERALRENLRGKGRSLQQKHRKHTESAGAFVETLDRFIDNHRILTAFCGIVIVALILVYTTVISNTTYYEYSYRGHVLGVVSSKQDIVNTLDIVSEKLKTFYGSEVKIDADEDLTYRTVRGRDIQGDTPDEILTALSYLHDIEVYGYAIVADGRQVCVLNTQADANAVLNRLINSYADADDDSRETYFKEAVRIVRVSAAAMTILSTEEAYDSIVNSNNPTKTYTVVSGDTFADIARIAGLTVSDLRALNPDVEPDRLKIGQTLVLEKEAPPVTVVTSGRETYTEEIPYDVEYTESASMYQGESRIQVAGVNGSRTVTAIVTRENGKVVSTDVEEEVLLSSPVTQKVLRGEKEVPAREGTGTFIWPTSGTISSKYGMRWGRLHKGLDIAKSTGTLIVAADGGTVISAGWESSYGYIVRISHGNGISTCYAHCSKILVKVGQQVYQGETIALMGSTGNSTGPHLHFEVQINGTPKDPLQYLP